MIAELFSRPEWWLSQSAFAIWALLATWGCTKLWQAHARVQDQRLKDTKEMRDEYHKLVTEINHTLRLLIELGRSK